jgi:hypothetical protein
MDGLMCNDGGFVQRLRMYSGFENIQREYVLPAYDFMCNDLRAY